MPLYNPSNFVEVGLGDVSGPASATDNAIVRFDGTGGKTLQNSTVTLGDSGAWSNSLTADVVGMSLKGHSSQTNKVFRIERGSNTDQVFSIDNNGSINTLGDLTVNNLKTNMNTNMEFSNDPSSIAWTLTPTSDSITWTDMVRLRTPRAGTKVLSLKAHASQSANIFETINDSDVVTSSIGATGRINAVSGLTVGSGEAISKIQTGTISVTVPALTAGDIADDGSTITGLADGDFVMVTPPNAAFEDGLVYSLYVSAPDTLTICMTNTSSSTLAGSTENWRYLVIKA